MESHRKPRHPCTRHRGDVGHAGTAAGAEAQAVPEQNLFDCHGAASTYVAQRFGGAASRVFQILEDIEVPSHRHEGQWGTVLEGRVDLTVSGETKIPLQGSSYNIPAGAVHSARLVAGTKLIDFFEVPNRHAMRRSTRGDMGT